VPDSPSKAAALQDEPTLVHASQDAASQEFQIVFALYNTLQGESKGQSKCNLKSQQTSLVGSGF